MVNDLREKKTIDSTLNRQVTGILAVRLKSVKGLPKKGSGNTDCHDCGTKRLVLANLLVLTFMKVNK